MQNFVNAIPPLNFLVCALLISVFIWLIQSWVRCFAHSNFHPPYSFISFTSTFIRFVGYAMAIPRIIGAFNGTNNLDEISQAMKANDFYVGITLVFVSYALYVFLLADKIGSIIGRQRDLKLINSTFGTEYKAKHWRDKQQITEVATYIKLGKEDVAQLISNPDFSADERRVIIDFVHYGLTVDQIRSYVENEKHFTLEGLQYGLYKMLFTNHKE